MNAVKLNIFISTWYKNANQNTFSKVTVIVNDKKFWKLHADEYTKRLQCSSPLFVFHLWLRCDVAETKVLYSLIFCIQRNILNRRDSPSRGYPLVQISMHWRTGTQETRAGVAMSLLVPHKNNLANVTIPYAKKFALCKTQL